MRMGESMTQWCHELNNMTVIMISQCRELLKKATSMTQKQYELADNQISPSDFSTVSHTVRVTAQPAVVSTMELAVMTPECPNLRAMV